MNNIERIDALIEQTEKQCRAWVKTDKDGRLLLVDPNDGTDISAHYGATHAAAAFIIRGISQQNEDLLLTGCALLCSILDRWDASKRLPAFHNDFNNFALCVAYSYICDSYPEVAERIRQAVLTTADSNNPTTNWLPMRCFVNRCRLEWTGMEQYTATIKACELAIQEATNADGGIEDRLPKGVSFNLQYDVATVSVMQYLSVHGAQYELGRELGFLLRAVAPDGDINYQGRGVNQIFAWSGWIYLLASASRNEELDRALGYLEQRLPTMLANSNMMLNQWEGKEKYLWWDYHYCSVYTAHLLLWLVLAKEDFGKRPLEPLTDTDSATGFRIISSIDSFGAVFEGREEYLAERGPAVVALATKRHGMLVKGSFAPWQGLFGNHHILEDVVIKNFCGPLSVRKNRDLAKNRLMRRFLPKVQTDSWLQMKPIFTPVEILDEENEVVIRWTNNSAHSELIINLPMLRRDAEMCFTVDGEPMSLYCAGSIRNQYDWVWLYQSHSFEGCTLELRIRK